MRIRLLNLSLLAALVLALLRFSAFLAEPPPPLPTVGPESPPAEAAAVEAGPDAALAEPLPEAYEVIVARDLFSPARGVVPPAPVAATKASPVTPPQPVPKLTLYGVVIVDDEKAAFLVEGAQEGRPRKVREKESFAGGVVTGIRPDSVTFLFGGSEIVVPLRTPKVGVAPPPPAGQEPGSVAPRPAAPAAAVPRRPVPGAAQQGALPAPGRPMAPTPMMPTVAPVDEPAGEVFGEEFPPGSMPEGEMPIITEEEAPE